MGGVHQAVGQKRRGLSADALKIIAITAMFVDHATLIFFPSYTAMPALALHMLGRITAPIMFYFAVEGYHNSGNKNRYTVRLALFAAISWLPFIFFRTGALPTAESFLDLNVIFTLLCGHLALRALGELRSLPLKVVCVIGCVVLSSLGDWGVLGVVYILLFDMFRGSFARQALGFGLYTVLQMLGPISGLVLGLSQGIDIGQLQYYTAMCLYYAAFFIPLVLLRFYNGEKGNGGKAMKWAFYIFYPLHLVVLGVVQVFWGA